MSLSDIAIRRPVFAWMLMAGLIIFGWLSFRDLGVSQLPDVDFPVANISVSLNGASPAVMESQVVDIIEDAVMGIQGIREVNSTSRQGSANISVEFELDRKIDVALQEIETRVAQVQGMLPLNMDPISVRKTNPEDQPILRMVLSTPNSMPRTQVMTYARSVLFDQFATVPGVGDITLGGYVDPNLRVWLSLEKLKHFQLTSQDVIQAIQKEHNEVPAGRLENSLTEQNIRFMGEATNPEDFGKLSVGNLGGGDNARPIRLNQVARVEEGLADVRRTARYNGQQSVGLEILKQHGSNAVAVANAVRKRLDEIRAGLPPGFTLDIRQDTTRFIQDSVDELERTLLLSALLTSIVCFFFLGSWTSTLNVLLAIPTSIVGTFMALKFLGFTLNTFTLLGLSLAIGVVVDDAIMMLENIVRHRELGLSRRRAAIVGANEITFAAVAATVAVVAIFLPVAFMKGVIGKYFFQYGLTVTVAVLLSLLEAVTLTPMRCSQYLTVVHSQNRFARGVDRIMAALASFYGRCLALMLKRPKTTIAVALLFFGVSMGVLRSLPTELIPPQDQSLILLRMRGPADSTLEFTDAKTRQVEDYLKKMPEVASYSASVGGGETVNTSMVFVTLKDPNQRKLSQAQLIEKFRKELAKEVKGMRIVPQDLSLRGFSSSRGHPVEVSVQGPDWDTLTKSAEALVEELNNGGPVVDANTDYQKGMPEVKIIPNRDKLAQHGVSLNAISAVVGTLIGGSVLNAANRYTKGENRWDVRVRLEKEDRNDSDKLALINVRNNRGELVPLSKLVDFAERPALQSISRRNRERAISVYGNLAPGISQKDAIEYVRKVAKKVLPGEYHIEVAGNSKSLNESFTSLYVALLLGIFVSYMVLASQFDSFLHPIIVLMALPFSLSGAFIALKLAHQSLNVFSMIGLILLMGIVKKNSILLVDFTNQLRREGKTLHEALLQACPIRLRPILMTSVATIAGAIPAAIGMGAGSETRVPMAVAMIGGVAVSTLLTLLVVPCAYTLLARFEAKRDSEAEPVSVPTGTLVTS